MRFTLTNVSTMIGVLAQTSAARWAHCARVGRSQYGHPPGGGYALQLHRVRHGLRHRPGLSVNNARMHAPLCESRSYIPAGVPTITSGCSRRASARSRLRPPVAEGAGRFADLNLTN